MKGFVILCNDPMAVKERFSKRNPELFVCSSNCSAVFVPCEHKELELAEMQLAVLGHIELFHYYSDPKHRRGVDFFCNEEGLLASLPHLGCKVGQHYGLRGDVLVCGRTTNGDSISLDRDSLTSAMSEASLIDTQLDVGKIKEWVDAEGLLSPHLQKRVVDAVVSLHAQIASIYARL